MNTSQSADDMSSLMSCLAKARKDGYVTDFNITEAGLSSPDDQSFYPQEKIKVTNFYRFEGASDPSENAILYLLEISDGKKGTVTDAYGAYANPLISAFMDGITTIEKI